MSTVRADLDAGVEDLLLPVGRQLWIGLFPMARDPRDPAAEVLLVEAECLLAVPAIVHINIESH